MRVNILGSTGTKINNYSQAQKQSNYNKVSFKGDSVLISWGERVGRKAVEFAKHNTSDPMQLLESPIFTRIGREPVEIRTILKEIPQKYHQAIGILLKATENAGLTVIANASKSSGDLSKSTIMLTDIGWQKLSDRNASNVRRSIRQAERWLGSVVTKPNGL